MFSVRLKIFPGNLQEMFKDRVHDLGGNLNQNVCNNIYSVKLWNGLDVWLKVCVNIEQFKSV